jgi:hypothetical protein
MSGYKALLGDGVVGKSLSYITVMRTILGACGSVVVKAVCYTPEGRRFDTP